MRFPGVATLLIASLAACSATTVPAPAPTGTPGDGTGTGTPQDMGLVAPGGDTNPKGVAYPTANVGYTARKGTKPGNVINNYKFLGYPQSDITKGLQPVSLADYFDPEQKNYKIIHIIVSGVWCVFCKAETDALIPQIADFKSKKVVF